MTQDYRKAEYFVKYPFSFDNQTGRWSMYCETPYGTRNCIFEENDMKYHKFTAFNDKDQVVSEILIYAYKSSGYPRIKLLSQKGMFSQRQPDNHPEATSARNYIPCKISALDYDNHKQLLTKVKVVHEVFDGPTCSFRVLEHDDRIKALEARMDMIYLKHKESTDTCRVITRRIDSIEEDMQSQQPEESITDLFSDCKYPQTSSKTATKPRIEEEPTSNQVAILEEKLREVSKEMRLLKELVHMLIDKQEQFDDTRSCVTTSTITPVSSRRK